MLDIPATLTALASLVIAIGVIVSAVLSYRTRQATAAASAASANAQRAAEASQAEVIAIKGEVYEIGKRIDGRLSELLTEQTGRARAEGITFGEQAERDRNKP